MAKYLVGTSGWVYPHWRGRFYPDDLPQNQWLEFYCHHFSTVELNNSFYRLPSERAFLHWKEVTPAAFVFSVKVSRFITHLKKLRNAEAALENFISRAKLLGDKLGPLLYQLPPQMPKDLALLESFLRLLPKDLHHVVEFRNQAWLADEVYELLGLYGAGFCIYDMPDLATPVIATAGHAYVRFHGSSGLYSSSYSDHELETWARKIGALPAEKVHIYFNNDAEAYAVSNARTLAKLLG
jgi:uncharacterized protein YecE (DUF72 family)